MANHHYVPKVILRKFCFDSDSLWYFSKHSASKGIQRRNIRTVFQKGNLNSRKIKAGVYDDGLERFFSNSFDTKIPSIVEKLDIFFNSGSDPFIGSDRRDIIQLIYNQMRRTPEHLFPLIEEQLSSKNLEDVIREWEDANGPISEELEREIAADIKSGELYDRLKISTLARQSKEVLDEFNMGTLAVARPQSSRKQFIVGSQPVIRFENSKNTNFGTGDSEFWMTLAPNLAVGLFSKNKGETVFSLSDKHVEKINIRLLEKSQNVASKNKKLLESLVSRTNFNSSSPSD